MAHYLHSLLQLPAAN
jgi:hypothetical protein